MKRALLLIFLLLASLARPVPATADSSAYLDTDGDGLSDAFELAYNETHYGIVYHLNPANPDSDGDGLSDGFELKFGSSPFLSDTDFDGLGDAIEAFYGTNPRSPDTDGDHLSDKFEVYGDFGVKLPPSDPTSWDTDGDGIDDYFEVRMSLSWNGAEERPFYLNPDWDGDGIVDGNEILPYDDSYHPTVYPYSADEWDGPSHPSPLLNGQKFYICFTSPDCDGDGLNDRDELEAGTNPVEIDSDDDGLYDGWEVRLGTNPLAGDTDGDGLSDLEEVLPELAYYAYHNATPDWVVITDALAYYYNWTLDYSLTWSMVCAQNYDYLLSAYPKPIVDDSYFEYHGQVCFIPPATNPLSPDTDGDGLSDGEEVNFEYAYFFANITETRITHLNPANPDTDGDGLLDSIDVVPVVPEGVTEVYRSSTGSSSAQDLDSDGIIEGDSCAYFQDCDGDGISDNAEVTWWHTDMRKPDTDGDGLTDFEEISIRTDPTKPDTDGDGFSDFVEWKEGTDPTNPLSHPKAPPAIEVPKYGEVQEKLTEPPKPRVKREVKFLLNGKEIEPNEFITVVLDGDTAEFRIEAPPVTVIYPEGREERYNLSHISIYGNDDDRVEGGNGTYTITFTNLTEIGFSFVSFRVELNYGDWKRYFYTFNIEAKYRTEPVVKLLNATWDENLDVGKLRFECRFCKNVTITVPGALVNGQEKRTINFGTTGSLRFFYARIVPHRYTVPGEGDVGTVYTKYEDSVEVMKTGKDIGVLTAKMVEARSIGSKIVYGMVATAKGVKTIVGGVEAFIPEDEDAPAEEGIDARDSKKFSKDAFKEGLLDWVKEKLIDATFDYVTEKAVQYADESELEARRHETTYHVTVKACNDFGCRVYSFSVRGYAYDVD
ncbi:putative Calcium-binding protein [Thermococcus nautili]|uniref:calcium-binding protein n=1 Tax=Thermococcus nautili TaxID=195522 RepID=UPI0025575AB9|nr:calcium-binding protein [Thermococcus nautili]CAI1493846.1 putative Calcium-binding protein [Thermococcus nautili]